LVQQEPERLVLVQEWPALQVPGSVQGLVLEVRRLARAAVSGLVLPQEPRVWVAPAQLGLGWAYLRHRIVDPLRHRPSFGRYPGRVEPQAQVQPEPALVRA
jgi:hypothetical protein